MHFIGIIGMCIRSGNSKRAYNAPLAKLLLQQGQLCIPMHFYGKNKENSVSYSILKTNG